MDFSLNETEAVACPSNDYTTPFWCPYTRYQPSESQRRNGDYSTVEQGSVAPAERSYGPNQAMPQAAVHGGLFNAPETTHPWNAIRVTPTMTNYIQFNLRSARPPPGATEQYVGTERLGNNYAPMPNTYWFNPTNPEQQGRHMIKVTSRKDERTYNEDGRPCVKGTRSMF